MEALTIALICAATFGMVVALSTFIKKMLQSRDDSLNAKAQKNALQEEGHRLAVLAVEMTKLQKLQLNEQQLNKEAMVVVQLNQDIVEFMIKKMTLVQQFAEISLRVATAIINGEQSEDRKVLSDSLQLGMTKELNLLDRQILLLQKKRSNLLQAGLAELFLAVIQQETKSNDLLTLIFAHYTGLLEKVYLRRLAEVERKSPNFLSNSMKLIKMYFTSSNNLDAEQPSSEIHKRNKILLIENAINAFKAEEAKVYSFPPRAEEKMHH